jgi:hypothetical protein
MKNCAACNQPLIAGDPRHCGTYIDGRGKRHDHVLCASCFHSAMSSKAEHARIAALVELKFLDAEGHA